MKAPKLVTKESLQQMLDGGGDNLGRLNHIIGRATVVLYNNQTSNEQATLTTRLDNGIGFASCDARVGSLSAQYYIRNNTLEHWMVKYWLKQNAAGVYKICKYHRQLNEAAELKQRKMEVVA